jgi:hypothetical protein
MAHRHSRVRTPNDNAHLERFSRTIQDECIAKLPRSFRVWQKEIPEYLYWYNERRPHLGLGLKTPIQKIAEILTPGSKLLTRKRLSAPGSKQAHHFDLFKLVAHTGIRALF